jgi:hypothetical protein
MLRCMYCCINHARDVCLVLWIVLDSIVDCSLLMDDALHFHSSKCYCTIECTFSSIVGICRAFFPPHDLGFLKEK